MGDSPYKIGYNIGKEAFSEWISFKNQQPLVSEQDAIQTAKKIMYLPDDCEAWNDTMTSDYVDGFIHGFVDSYKAAYNNKKYEDIT